VGETECDGGTTADAEILNSAQNDSLPGAGDVMTRAQWVGFFALCAMGASGWLVEGAWPSALPVAARECVHELVIAVLVGGFAWRGFPSGRARGLQWVRLAAASVCLLGVPAALIESTRGGVSSVTVAELLALVPGAVVVLIPAFEVSGANNTMRLLGPAVLGLAGVLLMLGFALPGTWRESRLEGVVAIAVVVAAGASVWMYRLLAGVRVGEAVVVCCAANAVFWLGVMAATALGSGAGWVGDLSWGGLKMECAKAVLFDMPQIVLLLWLTREVAPAKLAARWLAMPLLTVAEGYALLRPEVTVRVLAGAALVVIGVWRLMASDANDEEPRLVLR
jgi:hypothetical protein